MTMPVKVYIAGPYTHGGQAPNVRAVIAAGDQLRASGFLPFLPHLSHLWELVSPHDYDYWMSYCLGWLRACDVMLRLPGQSPGADVEEAVARMNEIPVYYDVEMLIEECV